MSKSNLELFKQILDDAVISQFDELAAACDEEIVTSEKHKLAMRTLIYGKSESRRLKRLTMNRIIAILVAAALLLTGCGFVFRHKIREVFEDLYVRVFCDSTDDSDKTIKDVYALGYVPEGYVLEKEAVRKTLAKYEYANENGETLCFEQRALAFSSFYVDSESGYSRIEEIEEREVYYRFTNKYHHYICWVDDNFVTIKSSIQLCYEEIVAMLDGIETK